jgi:hypothetical protein
MVLGPFATLLYTLGVYVWLDTCRPSGRVLLMGILVVIVILAPFVNYFYEQWRDSFK